MAQLTSSHALLGPHNLKALAHPLRIRLLGALRERGPATASTLGELLGESSGATSYHLRQLERFGFIEEDRSRGTARERWWRACHPSTSFDQASFEADPESRVLGREFLRLVAASAAHHAEAWLAGLDTLPEAWIGAGSMSDVALRLDPDQARALAAELEAVVARYPRFDPEATGTRNGERVLLQFQVLPMPSR